jgi:glucose/arabinose dehydrogenase
LTGQGAFGDWHADAPGVRRKITAADMPPPFATPSARDHPRIVPEPANARPAVPPGFEVSLFASGLDAPRVIRVAPNGDVFVAESRAGRIAILRAPDGAGRAEQTAIFATGLDRLFGIAFYPPGPDPHFVYIATTRSVLRFPYRSGDLRATGPAETVVPVLAQSRSGHWTRDVAFSADGKRLFVSVGSASNDGEEMPHWDADRVRDWEAAHGTGAAWGDQTFRADVLAFDPDGGNRRIFATGLRNCVGVAVNPATGDPWCSVNERDGLGDNLPPDYVTRVREGGFYGWPWYYIGDHPDPRHQGQRPDLADKVIIPDVLIQPHSAPLEMVFYDGAMFPADYRGSAFVALHGSWNREQRTGYKVVRAIVRNGVPTGEYEDFLTGFVTADGNVWARPVGVAVAKDGALLVGEDGNGTIWRVGYNGPQPAAAH